MDDSQLLQENTTKTNQPSSANPQVRSDSLSTIAEVPNDVSITGDRVIDQYDLIGLIGSPDLCYDYAHRAAYFQRLRALALQDAERKTVEIMERRLRLASLKHAQHMKRLCSSSDSKPIFSESADLGEMRVEGDLATLDTHENVQDIGGETVDTADPGPSQIQDPDGARTTHHLDAFFERPVSIFDSTFVVGTEYNVPLKVWDLWSKNPAVRAKLSNYAYFRGDLHIKIAVSGTPFHYGRLMLSYQPYPSANGMLLNYDQLFTAPPAGRNVLDAYKNYLSQAPGVYYIDIKENEPVTIDIPFISYKQIHRLFNSDNNVITNAISFEDLEEAGELRLVTLNPFRVANEDYLAEASINVYAWASGVELGCITGTDINITAESKDVSSPPRKGGGKGGKSRTAGSGGGDEYAKPGPVQMVASAITAVGETLSSYPIIGPYARATSTMSAAVGKVASMFGWSKPVVLTPASFIKNNPFQNGATSAIHDTSLKISVDPKQELTVDQSVGGTWGDDEMAIPVIASRESFLTKFEWSRTDTAMTTTLWRSLVTPLLNTGGELSATATSNYQQMTPMSFATFPFSYWRGTVRFRFEVVCSKFHRGKLLFRYEPNVPQSSLIGTASAQLNQQNTVILDIQEAQEVTFDVAWAQPSAWLRVPSAYSSFALSYGSGISGFIPAFEPFSNGNIEVRAINELVQPADDASVTINVFVSCPDLHVAGPSDSNINLPRGLIYSESNELTINPNDVTHQHVNEMYFGEKIVSFRALLKRFNTYYVGHSVVASNNAVAICRGTHFPRYVNPPLVATRASSADGGVATLFDYLRGGYLFMRGGIRHRVVPWHLVATPRAAIEHAYWRVGLLPPFPPGGSNVDQISDDAVIAGNSYERFNVYRNMATPCGTVTFHLASNGGVEFETPFYSMWRFVFANVEDEGAGTVLSGISDYFSRWTATHMLRGSDANEATGAAYDMATGEDFTFLRFQGAPYYVIPGE
nr:MAG: putative capsid protein precursor [Labyrnavirus sp.]